MAEATTSGSTAYLGIVYAAVQRCVSSEVLKLPSAIALLELGLLVQEHSLLRLVISINWAPAEGISHNIVFPFPVFDS